MFMIGSLKSENYIFEPGELDNFLNWTIRDKIGDVFILFHLNYLYSFRYFSYIFRIKAIIFSVRKLLTSLLGNRFKLSSNLS